MNVRVLNMEDQNMHLLRLYWKQSVKQRFRAQCECSITVATQRQISNKILQLCMENDRFLIFMFFLTAEGLRAGMSNLV